MGWGERPVSESKQDIFEAIDYSRNPTWRRIFILLAFLPYIYIAISALYLYVRWDSIPARIPQHYGLFSDGVHIWASKGFWGVYFLLIFCGIVVTMTIPLFFLYLRHPFNPADPHDDSPFDRAREKLKTIIFILAVEHGIAVWICHTCIAGALYQHLMLKASTRHFGMISTAALLPVLFFVPLYYWLRSRQQSYAEDRVEKGDQVEDLMKHWKWGVFYWNPDNPSYAVPKRFGMGYTLNFAHRHAWVFLAMFLFPPILLLIIIVVLSCV
jgi:uncharacterized membrane protein